VPGDTIFSIGALALAWFVARLWIGKKGDIPHFPVTIDRAPALSQAQTIVTSK